MAQAENSSPLDNQVDMAMYQNCIKFDKNSSSNHSSRQPSTWQDPRS